MSVLEPRSALDGVLVPSVSPDAGVMLAERQVAVHQVAVRRAAELDLPAQGRSAAIWGGVALCFAPRTALLVGGARPDLARHVASVVDLSGGFVVLRLCGSAAVDVLSRGCRLDLDARAFPPGAVARTPIAHVAVIIYRHGTGFDLMVPATLARSFVHFLLQASAEFGCAVLPLERESA